MHRPASFTSAIFLFVIAIGHILRIIFGVQIVANEFIIPIWPSVLGIIISTALALWLLKERRAVGR